MNIGCARSEWLGAGLVFSAEELRGTWDDARISVLTPKFSLVPDAFFDEGSARELLGGTVALDAEDCVRTLPLPEFAAHGIYSLSGAGTLAKLICDTLKVHEGSPAVFPEQYWQLRCLADIPDYNKIVASFAEGRLYLTVAQGRTLLICNSYPAQDFTTAQYWIFLVMRNFQLNPEVSSIWFRTPLDSGEEMSLYNYFKSVVRL